MIEAQGVVLAAGESSAGTAGLVIVLLLCVASGFLFYFMSGSLKRMRAHVQDGDFAESNARRLAAKAANGSGDQQLARAAAGEDQSGSASPVIPRQPDDSAGDHHSS